MSGDALRQTVERFEGPLTRYAARLLGDVEGARDVVQETFLRLCRQDPARLDGHQAEWLFTVCRNLALDSLRKEKRMSPLDESSAGPGPAPAPPETAHLREAGSRLLEALDRLPGRQQEVLRLKFQEGLSYREIGRVMDLTVSNVGFLIHAGLKALRRQVPEPA